MTWMVEVTRKYRSFGVNNLLLYNLVFYMYNGNGFTCNRSSKHNGKLASLWSTFWIVETLCKNFKKTNIFLRKTRGDWKQWQPGQWQFAREFWTSCHGDDISKAQNPPCFWLHLLYWKKDRSTFSSNITAQWFCHIWVLLRDIGYDLDSQKWNTSCILKYFVGCSIVISIVLLKNDAFLLLICQT